MGCLRKNLRHWYSLSWPAILARVGLIFAVTVVLDRGLTISNVASEVVELGLALVERCHASGTRNCRRESLEAGSRLGLKVSSAGSSARLAGFPTEASGYAMPALTKWLQPEHLACECCPSLKLQQLDIGEFAGSSSQAFQPCPTLKLKSQRSSSIGWKSHVPSAFYGSYRNAKVSTGR